MNSPPRSPSPAFPLSVSSSTTAHRAERAPAELEFTMGSPTASLPAVLPMASTPNAPHHPDTTVDLDEVYLHPAQDQEAASSSSEDVEIYLNDLGLEGAVGSAASARALGIQIAHEPAAADSPLLQGAQTLAEYPWSRHTSTASLQEATSPLSGSPLLTPSHLGTHTVPPPTNTHSVTEGGTTRTPISSNTTSDLSPTIDAGPAATTPTIDTNSGPSPSLPPCTSTLHPNLELRTRLLSPVGDLVDSPSTPPVARMSTIPLPDMDDHDDPTTLLPRSMEQMDIREAQAVLRRSPQDKARSRGLTVANGGAAFVTPPPSSPLPALPIAATAPPQTACFPPVTSDSNTNFVGRGGSIPTTPTVGVLQSSTSYTQSQPLPQLPTFAPLSVINEGGPGMSKDDLHLNVMGGVEMYRESDEMQMNRAEMSQHQQRQNANVTISPVYQQYGTITVSNSVVSFPNHTSPTNSFTASSNVDVANGTSPRSASEMGRSGSDESGASGLSSQQKTPNVYINGLPPHFPEEQLHALAAPFGEVRSVRTFTRHVRDSESGYGFVLFETVEAAERCIIALRRYRNLHPTFSKQIHKIPGTVYAQPTIQGDSDSASPCAYNWDASSTSEGDDGDASFKARMEALADPTSTNLYMEGLPLSMDEPTLSALVSPHRVVSSRFFQTRLSNPPRIIAFVRLETRMGSEEVIERLHGRMVRGWNDTGSRISVRFADTSEQRELRRQERAVKEGGTTGEPSPGRLTIAQAALLNLRGQDFRTVGAGSAASPLITSLPSVTSNLAMKPSPPVGITSRGGLDWSAHDPAAALTAGGGSQSGREIIGAAREYGGNSALPTVGGHGLALGAVATNGSGGGRAVRLGNGAAGIDYGSAFAGSPIGTIGTVTAREQQQQNQHQRQYHTLDGMGDGMSGMGINVSGGGVQYPFQNDYPGRRESVSHQAQGRDGTMDPTMKALLESLGGGGVDHQQQQDYYRMQLERVSAYQQQQQPSASQMLQYPPPYGGSGVASTHTGYTPAEEYIMRVHAESAARQREYVGGGWVDQARAALLQQQQAAQRKRPSPLDLGRQGSGGSRRQDENGADIAMGVRGYRMHASLVGMSDEEVFHAQAQARGDEREVEQQQQTDEQQHQQEQGHHAHTRATTLPHQQQQHRNSVIIPTVGGPLASGRGQGQTRHYQHNSMSVSSTTALRTPQHASVATMGGNGSAMEQQQKSSGVQHQKRMSVGGDGASKPTMIYRSSYSQQARDAMQGQRQDLVYDDLSLSPTSSADSPSLISPALTYSSQTHTPSTLSPATPFFGSFNSQVDGFRGAGVVEGGGKGGVEAAAASKAHSLKTRLA